MSTEDNRKTGPKEYIGHMDVIRGKTMNEVIFWESQLADGHYNLYVKLQPCPECEKLKAKIDLTNTLAQQSNQDHLNVRKDYQGEIIKLKAERDELAVQVEAGKC